MIAGISLYATHTNLDSADGGMSHALGRRLGLRDMRLLCPHAPGGNTGYGVVGELAEAVPILRFLSEVKRSLRLRRDTLQSALPQYGFPSRSVDRGGGLADRGRGRSESRRLSVGRLQIQRFFHARRASGSGRRGAFRERILRNRPFV